MTPRLAKVALSQMSVLVLKTAVWPEMSFKGKATPPGSITTKGPLPVLADVSDPDPKLVGALVNPEKTYKSRRRCSLIIEQVLGCRDMKCANCRQYQSGGTATARMLGQPRWRVCHAVGQLRAGHSCGELPPLCDQTCGGEAKFAFAEGSVISLRNRCRRGASLTISSSCRSEYWGTSSESRHRRPVRSKRKSTAPLNCRAPD